MKKSRFSEEQIIGILKEHEAGVKVADLCRRHGMSPETLCKWKSKFDGLEVSDAKRLRALEAENAKLMCYKATIYNSCNKPYIPDREYIEGFRPNFPILLPIGNIILTLQSFCRIIPVR